MPLLCHVARFCRRYGSCLPLVVLKGYVPFSTTSWSVFSSTNIKNHSTGGQSAKKAVKYSKKNTKNLSGRLEPFGFRSSSALPDQNMTYVSVTWWRYSSYVTSKRCPRPPTTSKNCEWGERKKQKKTTKKTQKHPAYQ